ncbi:MAG: glycoside hydrolase family 16 protein [Myxococcales bacterium]
MRTLFLACCLSLVACTDADSPGESLDAGSPPTNDGGKEEDDDTAHDAAPEDTSDDPGEQDAGRDAGKPDGKSDAGAGQDLPGWKLVWNDEFDGPAGTVPDKTRWVPENKGDGFGNNQLEFDTNRAENAALDGKGQLIITARKEEYMGRHYTSARLKTQGKFEHSYGRYEARMQIPFGQGMWPAFWMLGTNIGSAGWPDCGEIDIMENIGREPTLVHGTLHGPGYSGGNGIGASSSLPKDAHFSDAFHVYAIEWEKEVVRWYVDGELYQTRTPKDLPGQSKWVYDHSFFILLNLAVGGQWPGNPDNTTTFPQQLKVDYLRVYDRMP